MLEVGGNVWTTYSGIIFLFAGEMAVFGTSALSNWIYNSGELESEIIYHFFLLGFDEKFVYVDEVVFVNPVLFIKNKEFNEDFNYEVEYIMVFFK